MVQLPFSQGRQVYDKVVSHEDRLCSVLKISNGYSPSLHLSH